MQERTTRKINPLDAMGIFKQNFMYSIVPSTITPYKFFMEAQDTFMCRWLVLIMCSKLVSRISLLIIILVQCTHVTFDHWQ